MGLSIVHELVIVRAAGVAALPKVTKAGDAATEEDRVLLATHEQRMEDFHAWWDGVADSFRGKPTF